MKYYDVVYCGMIQVAEVNGTIGWQALYIDNSRLNFGINTCFDLIIFIYILQLFIDV